MYKEDPEKLDLGVRYKIEAFLERIIVINFQDVKVPHFFGTDPELLAAQEQEKKAKSIYKKLMERFA